MFRDRLRSTGAAALIALALLVAGQQITLHGGYAPHPMYRAQVAAMLDGRLALTTAPEGLVHDLAWTPSGVQQVWGLGAPLWQLPFELVGRALGYAPFPDRVALFAWLTAVLYAVLRAFRPRRIGEVWPREQRSDAGRPRALDSRAFQIGAVLLTALLPPIVTLLRGRLGVYEEAAVYAYGAALMLLCGLVAMSRNPTTRRYLIVAGCAGLVGLIRPTVWFYGLATLIAASAILIRQRGRPAVRVIALGAALFVASGGVLYATNAVRFGRGSEFGHRLNIHALPGNIVATRFSYPFERAPTGEAALELVTGLFDRPELRSKRGFYLRELHRGQSELPRWREYYFTTFSWPYAAALLAGLGVALAAWRRRGDPFARTLGAWAVLGGAPLVAFYLHAPSISSRYQLDLAPAIAALLVVLWRECVARWGRPTLAALVVLWAVAIATSKFPRPRGVSDPVDRATAADRADAITDAIAGDRRLPGAYELADPQLAVWLDGAGALARCSDATGEQIACDAPPAPGDVQLRARRGELYWQLERYTVPDEPELPAWVCRHPDEEEDAAPAPVLDASWLAPRALYLNGTGWQLDTGRVPPATLFYVDDPAYIALDVTGPPGTEWDRAVRVAVGLDHYRLVAAADTAGGAELRFERVAPSGSASPSRQAGLRVAFIAFGPDDQLDQPLSRFGLRAIRWRD